MAESRKAYERVVREFSDQNEQAAAARGRLSTLGEGPTSSGVRVRQVWTKAGLDLYASSILQDGRRIAYIDWASQDSVAIADMVTGESRKLTTRTDGDGAYELAVSPDSKLIAYAWYSKKGEELRVTGVDGSAPRTIYSNPEVEAEPAAWFPDGKHLVSRFFKKDQASQLAVISIGDGKARVLKSGAWGQTPRNISVSPDGQYILYDFPPSSETPERDIHLMAADGSSETVLVRHPANDILMGWSPDGKHILFRSNRSGSMSLYALPMPGNRPAGEPRQLRSNVGNMQPLGFARNGSLYYSESIGTGREVYLVELDPETGKMAGTLRLASTKHLGQKGGVRTIERDLKSGQETILVPEVSGTFRNQGARNSEDWKWLVWRSIDSNGGEIRLMSRRASGGEPITLVTVKRPVDLFSVALAPDSKHVLFARGENGNDEIWRVPIAGGTAVADRDPGNAYSVDQHSSRRKAGGDRKFRRQPGFRLGDGELAI